MNVRGVSCFGGATSGGRWRNCSFSDSDSDLQAEVDASFWIKHKKRTLLQWPVEGGQTEFPVLFWNVLCERVC